MITLQELAKLIEGQVVGNSDHEITGVSEIQNGVEGTIAFLSNSKYRKFVENTSASAIIAANEDALLGSSGIVVKNPQLAFAKVMNHFYKSPLRKTEQLPRQLFGKMKNALLLKLIILGYQKSTIS